MNKFFIFFALEIGLEESSGGGGPNASCKMCCAAGVLRSAVGTEVPWP